MFSARYIAYLLLLASLSPSTFAILEHNGNNEAALDDPNYNLASGNSSSDTSQASTQATPPTDENQKALETAADKAIDTTEKLRKEVEERGNFVGPLSPDEQKKYDEAVANLKEEQQKLFNLYMDIAESEEGDKYKEEFDKLGEQYSANKKILESVSPPSKSAAARTLTPDSGSDSSTESKPESNFDWAGLWSGIKKAYNELPIPSEPKQPVPVSENESDFNDPFDFIGPRIQEQPSDDFRHALDKLDTNESKFAKTSSETPFFEPTTNEPTTDFNKLSTELPTPNKESATKNDFSAPDSSNDDNDSSSDTTHDFVNPFLNNVTNTPTEVSIVDLKPTTQNGELSPSSAENAEKVEKAPEKAAPKKEENNADFFSQIKNAGSSAIQKIQSVATSGYNSVASTVSDTVSNWNWNTIGVAGSSPTTTTLTTESSSVSNPFVIKDAQPINTSANSTTSRNPASSTALMNPALDQPTGVANGNPIGVYKVAGARAAAATGANLNPALTTNNIPTETDVTFAERSTYKPETSPVSTRVASAIADSKEVRMDDPAKTILVEGAEVNPIDTQTEKKVVKNEVETNEALVIELLGINGIALAPAPVGEVEEKDGSLLLPSLLDPRTALAIPTTKPSTIKIESPANPYPGASAKAGLPKTAATPSRIAL